MKQITREYSCSDRSGETDEVHVGINVDGSCVVYKTFNIFTSIYKHAFPFCSNFTSLVFDF